MRNETVALKKLPTLMTPPPTWRTRLLKSGLPTVAAISGFSTSATSEVTMALNAAPRITATARSTTLPRKMKSRNPLNICSSEQFHVQPMGYAAAGNWPGRELPVEHSDMLHGEAGQAQRSVEGQL